MNWKRRCPGEGCLAPPEAEADVGHISVPAGVSTWGGGGNTALRWPENSLIMEAGAPALSCLRQHTCNSNGSSPRRPKTKFILHHFWFELLTKPHPWGLVKWLIRGKGGVDPHPPPVKLRECSYSLGVGGGTPSSSKVAWPKCMVFRSEQQCSSTPSLFDLGLDPTAGLPWHPTTKVKVLTLTFCVDILLAVWHIPLKAPKTLNFLICCFFPS